MSGISNNSSDSRPSEAPPTTWDDVLKADRTRRFPVVTEAVVRYVVSNPGENFRSVECRLRKGRCFSYLTAVPTKQTQDCVDPVSLKPAPYLLLVSTGDRTKALRERRFFQPNAQINAECLLESGILVTR